MVCPLRSQKSSWVGATIPIYYILKYHHDDSPRLTVRSLDRILYIVKQNYNINCFLGSWGLGYSCQGGQFYIGRAPMPNNKTRHQNLGANGPKRFHTSLEVLLWSGGGKKKYFINKMTSNEFFRAHFCHSWNCLNLGKPNFLKNAKRTSLLRPMFKSKSY